MGADAVQTMFEEACNRLFTLHADGYKRPKPAIKPIRQRPSVTTSVRPGSRQLERTTGA